MVYNCWKLNLLNVSMKYVLTFVSQLYKYTCLHSTYLCAKLTRLRWVPVHSNQSHKWRLNVTRGGVFLSPHIAVTQNLNSALNPKQKTIRSLLLDWNPFLQSSEKTHSRYKPLQDGNLVKWDPCHRKTTLKIRYGNTPNGPSAAGKYLKLVIFSGARVQGMEGLS